MADKRISQLIERVDIANNDVLPIVASGATTTNKVTVSTLQDWMQDNLDVGVTSVGLSMPSAFVVSNSPVTSSGNISVTGAGSVSQYVRGDGSLAEFPTSTGGGSSISYYLNTSVSQGTIGGVAYSELSKSPVLGAGTDLSIAADGYIASYITDVAEPGLIFIPGGNWNFETYLSASSAGGSPSFYVELYKVSGATATLIATNSGTPKPINLGTTINAYFSSLAVPETILTLTDRLALRYYVLHSGKTITIHTENNHLCQVITTFSTGISALNGLTVQVQNLATGTSGTDFNITSSVSTHNFNLPDASASARGVVNTGSQTFAGTKTFNSDLIVNGITVGKGIGANNGNNTAIGLNCLSSNTTGTLNTATGLSALAFNTAGNSNTANGANSLVANTTGGFNTASGNQSLYSNTTGQANTAIGINSLYSNTTGTYNIGVGSGAGYYIADGSTPNTTSDFSIYLGADTKASVDNAQNEIVIGYNAIGSGSNTVTIGNTSTTNNYFTGNIRGGAFMKSGGTSSQFLMADGSVNTSVLASGSYLPLAGGTLTGALNGTSAVFSGSVTGSNAILTGVGGVLSRTGSTTTAVYGLFLNTSGGLYFGSEGSAGGTVITGNPAYFGAVSAVSGLGFSANNGNNVHLSLASTGAATFSSSAAGYGATITNIQDSSQGLLVRATDNDTNLYLLNLQSSNTTTGQTWVDRFAVTKSGNVGIGTSSPNFFGYGSGVTVLSLAATASDRYSAIELVGNRGIGENQNGNIDFVNNVGTATVTSRITALNGASSVLDGILTFHTRTSAGSLTERMRITSGGNVGIGTDSPVAISSFTTLDIRGATGGGIRIGKTSFSSLNIQQDGVDAYLNNVADGHMFFLTNDAYRVMITNGGILRPYYDNTNTLGASGARWSAVWAANGTIQTSDEREKKDIIDSDLGLDFVNQLRPVSFKWKVGQNVVTREVVKDEEGNPILDEEGNEKTESIITPREGIRTHYGLIAQEVEELLDGKDFGGFIHDEETDIKGLRYDQFVPLLIKAIQELKTEIDLLKNQMQ